MLHASAIDLKAAYENKIFQGCQLLGYHRNIKNEEERCLSYFLIIILWAHLVPIAIGMNQGQITHLFGASVFSFQLRANLRMFFQIFKIFPAFYFLDVRFYLNCLPPALTSYVIKQNPIISNTCMRMFIFMNIMLMHTDF